MAWIGLALMIVCSWLWIKARRRRIARANVPYVPQ